MTAKEDAAPTGNKKPTNTAAVIHKVYKHTKEHLPPLQGLQPN